MDLFELSPEMLARGRAVLLRYLPGPGVGGGVSPGVIGPVLLGLAGGLALLWILERRRALGAQQVAFQAQAIAALPPPATVPGMNAELRRYVRMVEERAAR